MKEEEKLNIYQKLHKIQCEIKGLSKDKKSHNYEYVTGNKLLSFIKPLMDELGLLLKQEIISIENTRQDYQVWDKWAKPPAWKPKNEILSKVNMKFTWIDVESGEKDENLFGANGQNDWEKGLGSALTYGERYFLLKYFHIATDEDDIDNPDRKPKDPAQPKPPETPKKTPPKKKKMTKTIFDQAVASEKIDVLEKSFDAYEMTTEQAGAIALRIETLKEQQKGNGQAQQG